MDALNIPYEVLPSQIDEKQITGKTEIERAKNVARAKAESVFDQYPEAIVIAADTYTVIDGIAHEKPESILEAKEMLKFQSGKTGVCLTGFAYIDGINAISHVTTVETQFAFRKLSKNEIERYVESNPVTTWSAAFSPAYPEGINLVREVGGSLSSFSHGIPIELVMQLLEQSKVFDQ